MSEKVKPLVTKTSAKGAKKRTPAEQLGDASDTGGGFPEIVPVGGAPAVKAGFPWWALALAAWYVWKR